MQKNPQVCFVSCSDKDWFCPIAAASHEKRKFCKSVIIDENLTWKNYIEVIENQIS